MDPEERRRLLARAREWFGEPAQVKHYRDEVASGPTAAEERLLRELPASGRVLDLGSGAGRLSFYLSERGYAVTGVEVSGPLLEVARRLGTERGSAAVFRHVEAMTLPFPDESFDAAVASKVYCYIPSRAGRADYLEEVARVLRNGAPLLLTGHILATERQGTRATDTDDAHRRAAADFHTLDRLDFLPEGRGYVHWFTTAMLREELTNTGPFDLERLDIDPENELFCLAVLRRTT